MLSDGVFAVLITVLVLELRPPELPTFKAPLLLWPTLLSYAVSYLFIAIVWTNHHCLMRFATEANPRLLWFNFASVFHFPASALYGLDGGEQIGAATRRVLCGGFLPGECDLRMFDLGAHSRSRGFAGRARHHALSIALHLMPFWNCRHCCAEISAGWTRYLRLLSDRLSEARSARIGEVKISRKTQAPLRPFGRFVDLSVVRRDPAPLWLCRFCASALAKSSGHQPPGN